jgi:eukaryotic-like serine/threonine-protein kinase
VTDRYQLLELAGDGGMARVYRALTRGAAGFQRPVAIKRIHEHLIDNSEFVRMFIEEARVCSELDHPNIVQVHDFGMDEQGYFLVMEWVEGLSLGQYVRGVLASGAEVSGRLACAIVVQLLAGLAEAHERLGPDLRPAPVIHRDITPQNVLVSVGGAAKLADFGLSRAMDRARMTQPDVVKGKLSYLAPELTQGKAASVQSDLYGVGILLWEALAGERLFWADDDRERVRKVRSAEVPPLADKRPDLPRALTEIVHATLAYDPAARPGSADLLAKMLMRAFAQDPVSPRELGQSVCDARVALGMEARAPREPPPTTTQVLSDVLMRRVVIVKSEA